MKQETIEEAAEKEFPLLELTIHSSDKYVEEENLHLLGHRNSFINGAKWQAERMYSEEEVKSILLKTDRFLRADLDIWFEQFRKKA